MVEPLGKPVNDRSLEGVVVQDGRVNEGRELGLASDHVLRLAADAEPNRIDGVEGRSRLVLRHRSTSRNDAFYHNWCGAASGTRIPRLFWFWLSCGLSNPAFGRAVGQCARPQADVTAAGPENPARRL